MPVPVSFGRSRVCFALLVLALGLLVSAMTTGRADGAPSLAHTQALPPRCVDLLILFARGSGQNGVGHPLTEQNEFFGRVRSHVPGGLSIAEYRLGQEGELEGHLYPAVDVPWAVVGSARYGGSVKAGIREMTSLLRDRAQRNCPQERWILGGYSQGAHVVGTTVAEQLTRSERRRIAFVALFGDPKLVTTRGRCARAGLAWWVRGDAVCGQRGIHTRGVSSPRPEYAPADLRGRFGSWCDRRDGVCAAGIRRVNNGSHKRYADMMINQAAVEASRVLRRLKAAGGAQAAFVPDNSSFSGSVLRIKPRMLVLGPISEFADGGVEAVNLHWRDWGSQRATGFGTIVVGDPDNGFSRMRGRVVLTQLRRNACGGDTPRWLYHRAQIIGARKALGTDRFTFQSLLVC